MTKDELLAQVEKFAGPQRNKTFRAAAEWILDHATVGRKPFAMVETGCYRGIPADGQSTMILALLGIHLECSAVSIELDPNHISQAKAHLKTFGLDGHVTFLQGDSVTLLHDRQILEFLYVDSFDCDLKDPFPSQRHQLAEIGAAYGAFHYPAAILMDDCLPECHGGKTGMSAAFLKERGWKLVAEGYQLLYVKDSP